MRKPKKILKYKVAYQGTRKTHKYATKREALAQAKYAVGTGNMVSCVYKLLPASSSWQQVKCVRRSRRK